MKIKKKISFLLTLFLVCAGFLMPISAEETVIPTETGITGSITIKLTDTVSGHFKSGVKFGLTKVADLKDGEYVMLSDYESSGVDFNAINKANDLETASRELRKLVEPEKTILTNDEGVAEVKDLEVGVYLVYVLDVAGYENITPFLIAIPTFDKIDKVMIYDVSVMPKHSPLPDIKVRKVDKKTNKNITNKEFEFTIYEDEDCTKELAVEKGNKKNGTATFKEVTFGTYYLKETKAPKGYKLSDEVVKVVIDDSFATSDKQVKTIVYYNTPLPAKVQTGDNSQKEILMTLFLCSGVVLVGGIIYRRRQKHQA